MKIMKAALAAVVLLCGVSSADEHAGPQYVPYRASSIYTLDETVGWHVTLPWNAAPVTYVIRKNNLDEIGRGSIKPGTPSKIEVKLGEPGMVYVEVTEKKPDAKPKALGAAVVDDHALSLDEIFVSRVAG